jgi:hypothetical protein
MEAESPLQTLPQREYDRKVSFSGSQQKQLMTNYFEIKFGKKYDVVYQFMFDTEPQIPQDSKELLFKVVKSIRNELNKKVGLITASGLMIWGYKKLDIPLSIKTTFMLDSKEYRFDVIIKPTKSLDVVQLRKTKDGMAIVNQLYNNIIKDVLREKKLD